MRRLPQRLGLVAGMAVAMLLIYRSQLYVGSFGGLRGPAALEPVALPDALAIQYRPASQTLESFSTRGAERDWTDGYRTDHSLAGRGLYRSDYRTLSLDDTADLCVATCQDAVYALRLQGTSGAARLPELDTGWAAADGKSIYGWTPDAATALALDARTRSVTARLPAPAGSRFAALDLAPGGKLLAGLLKDADRSSHASLWVWPLPSGPARRLLADGPLGVCGVRFSPNGHYLAVETGAGRCSVLDTSKWEEIQSFPTGGAAGAAFRFSPDSRRIAYAERREREYVVSSLSLERRRESVEVLQIRSLATGAAEMQPLSLGEVRGHRDPITECVWSPDGYQVATLSWDGRIALWSRSTGRLLQFLEGKNHLLRE